MAQSCFLWQLLVASSAFFLSAASPSLFCPPGLSPVWPGRLLPSPTSPVWEYLPTMLWFLLSISITILFWGWKLWLGIVDHFLFRRILAVSTHLILCNLYFNLHCFWSVWIYFWLWDCPPSRGQEDSGLDLHGHERHIPGKRCLLHQNSRES